MKKKWIQKRSLLVHETAMQKVNDTQRLAFSQFVICAYLWRVKPQREWGEKSDRNEKSKLLTNMCGCQKLFKLELIWIHKNIFCEVLKIIGGLKIGKCHFKLLFMWCRMINYDEFQMNIVQMDLMLNFPCKCVYKFNSTVVICWHFCLSLLKCTRYIGSERNGE